MVEDPAQVFRARVLGRHELELASGVIPLFRQAFDECVPHLRAGLVVRGADVIGVEGIGPIAGRDPHIAARRFEGELLRRRLLVEAHTAIDRLAPARRGLYLRHPRIGLGLRVLALGHEVRKSAREHALLTEARQHVGDICEVGPVRSDDEHAAARGLHLRICIKQVRGAVQRDDGLTRAGSTVHDEWTPRGRADDLVLVRLDRAEYIAHFFRARGAQRGDERRVLVERCIAALASPRVAEHLVPVVDDAAAVPAVTAPRRHPHRLCTRGREKRFRGGCAPVDEQRRPVGVREPDTPDIHRFLPRLADNPAEAQVEREPPEHAELRRHRVDFQVPFECSLPTSDAGRAQFVQPLRDFGDAAGQTVGEAGEMGVIGRDEVRCGLRGFGFGQGEICVRHGGGSLEIADGVRAREAIVAQV